MGSTSPPGEANALIGRKTERAWLRSLFDAMRCNHGRLVLISGDAGIGKSTLIDVLAHEATQAGALVLSGSCYDLASSPPYGPWIELFRSYRQSSDLPPLPQQLQDHGLASVASREQLYGIVATFFVDVSDCLPVVLILEDLHWSDSASVELLRFLARQLTPRRILIVASYREDDLTRSTPLFATVPLLVREAHAERLALQPFDAETLDDLVRSRYALSHDDTRALVTYLVTHTEGNPLFSGELLRSMEHDHVLQERGGRWVLSNLEHVVPPTLIVQIIERQLRSISTETRQALGVAALIGQDIQLDLWRRVIGVPDARLATIIEDALTSRIIEQRGMHGLRIRHAVIRDVLYHGTLFPRRRHLHRQVAEALLESHVPDPDSVAYHFQHAGDERSLEWLIRAGDQADLAEAHVAAIERYEAALRLLGDDGARLRERGWLLLALGQTGRDIIAHRALAYTEEALRLGERLGDDALRAWSLYTLGENHVLVGLNGLPEMERGLALLQRVRESDVPSLPARFRRSYTRDVVTDQMASNVIVVQALFGRYREALRSADDYLTRVPPEGDVSWALRGHAEAARATALNALGDPEGAAAAYRRTQDAYQRANVTWFRALNVTTELHYGTLAYRADELTHRQSKAVEAERIWTQASGMTIPLPPRIGLLPLLLVEGAWTEARELTLPFASRDVVFYFDFARLVLGVIARAQGEPDRAWEQINTSLPDGPDTEPGAVWMLFTVDLQRLAVDLALDAGELSLAYHWIRAHDRWLDDSERFQGRAEAQLLRARYHRVSGDLEAARQHAERALEFARAPRQPLALIAADRMLGELNTVRARYIEAEQQLRSALTLAEACAAPYQQALTLLALAELSAATGQPDQAWQDIDSARALCVPLGATPALQYATTIAAKLSVQRGKPIHPAGLTSREMRVLQLVATGLTDAEVAQRLFISSRTVGQHLRSVYNKLGVNSRVEATRFAVEYGLTDAAS